MAAVVIASCVLCAGGRGSEQVLATVRSGIARITNSHVMDRHCEPIQMGLVPQDALEPLPDEIDALPLPSRPRRMLQLAAPVLNALAPAAGPTPVIALIGLPHLPTAETPWLQGFLKNLAGLSGTAFDPAGSRLVIAGRAAALVSIEIALTKLEEDPSATILVGGIDTFLDLRLLSELDAERRILGPRVMDGFIPGEGAAFLILKSAASVSEVVDGPPVLIHGAASVLDPGHRYGSEPARGEGLAHALDKLRGSLDAPLPPVATTFAGFNGESFEGKIWGVARLRHADLFAPDMMMQHPADCIGDTGAAAGAILTAVAATALAQGVRTGPALVWAASDLEPRACALLALAD
jgi:3-oxoacyl-[acyl-carrier-protein] synthase I